MDVFAFTSKLEQVEDEKLQKFIENDTEKIKSRLCSGTIIFTNPILPGISRYCLCAVRNFMRMRSMRKAEN